MRISESGHQAMTTALVILFFVAVWAGIQNALAGGGTFLTLPAMMFTGMSALAANITSTIALFPGQVTSSWGGRAHVAGAAACPSGRWWRFRWPAGWSAPSCCW
jgi:uncharacterized membrane protein YfcA